MKQLVKVILIFSLLLLSENAFAKCVGYSGPGGPCSTGPGGGLSTAPGGGLYTGPGGGLSTAPGGGLYTGPGGGRSTAPGGGLSTALAAGFPLALAAGFPRPQVVVAIPAQVMVGKKLTDGTAQTPNVNKCRKVDKDCNPEMESCD
jgi:hypothetical protein